MMASYISYACGIIDQMQPFVAGLSDELVKLASSITGQDHPLAATRSKTRFGAPDTGGPQNSGGQLLGPFGHRPVNQQPGEPRHHDPEKLAGERCRRCGKKATCLVLWAEGMGGIPSCETHKEAIAAPFKKKEDFTGFKKIAAYDQSQFFRDVAPYLAGTGALMGGVLPAPWLIAEKDAKKRHRKLLRNVLIGASVGGIPPLVASLLTKRANDPIKKRVTMHGIGMGIEWKKGEKRRYYDKKDPKKVNYEKLMKADYGYISGTKDHDGEQLDAYVGPNPKSTKVFVIKQLKDDGSFDEHKVMLGYDDLAAAKASYLDHMPAKRLGKIEETDVDGFKAKHLERAREMRKAAGRRFVAGFTKEISKTAPGKFKFPEWMLQSTWRPPEKIGRRRVKAQFRKAAGPRLKILRQLLGERFGELGLEDVVDVVGNVQDVKDRTTEIKGYRVERNQPAFKVAFVRGLADELEKLGTFVRERIREGGPGTRADNPPDLPPGVHSMSRTAARQKPWSGAAGSADAFGQQSTPKGADEVTEPMVSPSSPVDAFG